MGLAADKMDKVEFLLSSQVQELWWACMTMTAAVGIVYTTEPLVQPRLDVAGNMKHPSTAVCANGRILHHAFDLRSTCGGSYVA